MKDYPAALRPTDRTKVATLIRDLRDTPTPSLTRRHKQAVMRSHARQYARALVLLRVVEVAEEMNDGTGQLRR